jgi:hypothetical protein
MATYTDHFGLRKIQQGESFADDSYKFTTADRDTIDLLLYLGAEAHHHVGGGAPVGAPTDAANVVLVSTSGTIPAGRRVYYKYSLLTPSGVETTASPEVFVDTPAQVSAPGAPTLSFATTGGTLAPGNYYYVLSAYTGTPTFETPAVSPELLFVSGSVATNAITITLPALPSGANGFNVYRQAPGGPGYFFVASVDMGASPTTFVDTGIAPNCDRTRPTVNTTKQTNSVILTLPGATPSLAPGYSWRIYRTFASGDYTNSLLATVAVISYTDTGIATGVGQPPLSGASVGHPEKIVLTDAGEIQGQLPLSSVSAFPFTLNFSMLGDLFPLVGTSVWVCEYPQVTIIGARACLGRGYVPADADVVIDVNVGSGATPTMTSVYALLADQPKIPVGLQIGARAAPTADAELREGDVLTIDIDQTGGGATPTDRDLVVSIYGYAYGWDDPTSYVGVP